MGGHLLALPVLSCLAVASGLKATFDNEEFAVAAAPHPPNIIVTGVGDGRGMTAVIETLSTLGLGHCSHTDNRRTARRAEMVCSLLRAGHGEVSHKAFMRDRKTFNKAIGHFYSVAQSEWRCIKAHDSRANETKGKMKWGFSEPHVAWLLPAIDEAYLNQTNYLVVARDPRDVCTNYMQDQFRAYGKCLGANTCYEWWARFWIKLLQGYEAKSRFAVLRIEDIVVPDPATSNRSTQVLSRVVQHAGMNASWASLHKVLMTLQQSEETSSVVRLYSDADGGTLDKPQGLVSKAVASANVKSFHRRNTSYMGHHHHQSESFRQALVHNVSQMTHPAEIHEAMLQLGYNPLSFELLLPKSNAVL